MSEELPANEEQQGEVKPTPGRRLRAAREQLGLNLQDIALHLKLDVEKIADLENDQVDSIAAPVFLSGYLRAYARLVDLSGDELTAEFEQMVEMTSPALKPTPRQTSAKLAQVPDSLPAHMTLSKTGRNGLLVAVLLIVLALVAGGFWWNSQQARQLPATDEQEPVAPLSGQGQPPGTAPLPSAAETENAEAPKPDTLRPEVFKPQVSKPAAAEAETTEAGPQAETESSLPPLPGQMPERSGETVVAQDIPTKANAPVLNPGQLALLMEDRGVETPGEDLSPQDLEAAPISLEGLQQEQLTFVFIEDSWVEVNDALDRRLLYRLGLAGSDVSVAGVAPFSVHLGYQPGVKILLNGDPYDLSRFANRRSVRFTLNASPNKQQRDNG